MALSARPGTAGSIMSNPLYGRRRESASLMYTPDRSGDALVFNNLTQEQAHQAEVTGIALDPTGTVLFSSSSDKHLKAWEFSSGKYICSYMQDEILRSVQCTSNGLIMTITRECVVRWFKLVMATDGSRQFQRVGEHTFDKDECRHVTAHFDAQRGVVIATCSIGRAVCLLEIGNQGTGAVKTGRAPTDSIVFTSTISSDGKLFAGGCRSGEIVIYRTDGDGKFLDPQLTTTITRPDEAIRCLAFTKDNTKLLSGCNQNLGRLWNVEDGSLLATFKGHGENICSIAFLYRNDVEEKIITASNDKSLRVWDIETQVCEKKFLGHTDYIRGVIVHPSQNQIVSCSKDQSIIMYDVQTCGIVGSIPADKMNEPPRHSSKVTALKAIPALGQTDRLISASYDDTVRIWDPETGEQTLLFSGHDDDVNGVAISSDGTFAVTACDDGTVLMWSTQDGHVMQRFNGRHKKYVLAIDLSRDGRYIASGSMDETAIVWSTETGEIVTHFREHDAKITCISISCDSALVATGSTDMVFFIFQIETGQVLVRNNAYTEAIRAMCFSPINPRELAVGTNENDVRIWEVADGESRRVGQIMNHDGNVCALQYSHDGRRLLTGTTEKLVREWDLTSQECTMVYEGCADKVRTVTYLARKNGSEIVAASGDDGHIVMWARTTSRSKQTSTVLRQIPDSPVLFEAHRGEIMALRVFGEGQYLVSASYDDTARVWNLHQQKLLSEFTRHTDDVNDVDVFEYSKDTQEQPRYLCATASDDKTIMLWNPLESSQKVRTLKGHRHYVAAVRFTCTGEKLISGGRDNLLIVWGGIDKGRDNMLHKISRHSDSVLTVATHPTDSSLFLSGGADDKLILWRMRDGSAPKDIYTHKFTETVRCTSFHPSNTTFAAGTNENTVAIFDAAKCEQAPETGPLITLSGHDGNLGSLEYVPGGRFLVTGGNDNKAMIWDLHSNSQVCVFDGHRDYVRAVAYVTSRQFVSSSKDKSILLWTADAHGVGKLVCSLQPDHGTNVTHQVSKGAFSMMLEAPEGAVYHDSRITSMAWSSKHHVGGKPVKGQIEVLLAGDEVGYLTLWNLPPNVTQSPNYCTTLKHPAAIQRNTPVTHTSVSLFGDYALACGGSTVAAWDLRPMLAAQDQDMNTSWTSGMEGIDIHSPDACCHLVFKETTLATCASFLTNSRFVLGGFDDGQVAVWDWQVVIRDLQEKKTSEPIKPCGFLEQHTKAVTCIAAAESRIATACKDEYVLIYSSAIELTGERMEEDSVKPLQTIQTSFEDGVVALQFRPDESQLAAGSNEGAIAIYCALTGTQLQLLYGHFQKIINLAFSEITGSIVSCAEDSTIRLWDGATNKPIRTHGVSDQNRQLTAMTTDQSGQIVLAGDASGAIQRFTWISSQEGMERLSKEETSKSSGTLFACVHSVVVKPNGSDFTTWNLAKPSNDPDFKAVFGTQEGNITCLYSFSQNVQQHGNEFKVAFGTDTGAMMVHSTSSEAEGEGVTNKLDHVQLISASADTGCVVAIGKKRGMTTMIRWSPSKSPEVVELATFESALSQPTALVACPDGTVLVGYRNGRIEGWTEVEGKAESTEYHKHDADVSSIAASPCGQRFATASYDGQVRFWRQGHRKEEYAFKVHEARALNVDFTQLKEHIILVASDDSSCYIWLYDGDRGLSKPWKVPASTRIKQAEITHISYEPEASLDVRLVLGSHKGALEAINVTNLIEFIQAPATAMAPAWYLERLLRENEVEAVAHLLEMSPHSLLYIEASTFQVDQKRVCSSFLLDLIDTDQQDSSSDFKVTTEMWKVLFEWRGQCVLKRAEPLIRKIISATSKDKCQFLDVVLKHLALAVNHPSSLFAADDDVYGVLNEAVAEESLQSIVVSFFHDAGFEPTSHAIVMQGVEDGTIRFSQEAEYLTRAADRKNKLGLWQGSEQIMSGPRDFSECFVTPFSNLLSSNLFETSINHSISELYETEVFRAMVDFKWNTYGRRKFMRFFSVYLASLVLITIMAFLPLPSEALWETFKNTGSTPAMALSLVCAITQVCWVVFSITHEFHQAFSGTNSATKESLINYMREPWNVFDLVQVLITLSAILTYCFGVFAYRPLLAVTLYLRWLGLFYFLQALPYTGALIRMVFEIINDIKFFLVVLFIGLMAVASSMHVLLYEIQESYFSGLLDSLFATFNGVLLVNYEVDSWFGEDKAAVRWAKAIFILSAILIPIVLLNLLIALMSDSYEHIQDNSVKESALLRARIIMEQESFFKQKDREKSKWFPKYLHVMKPRSGLALKGQAYIGVLNEMKNHVSLTNERAERRLFGQLQKLTSAQQEEMALLTEKIARLKHTTDATQDLLMKKKGRVQRRSRRSLSSSGSSTGSGFSGFGLQSDSDSDSD
eukprot:m.213571 g.213571  ORF g.213571 m.213571 type:complete len:2376 (-) comp15086_c0_seq1:317-7444(-)